MASFHHYINDGSENNLQVAEVDGLEEISLLISVKNCTLPLTNPKALKDEILQVVAQPKSIDVIRRNRCDTVLIVTKSAQTAQSLLNGNHLLNIFQWTPPS